MTLRGPTGALPAERRSASRRPCDRSVCRGRSLHARSQRHELPQRTVATDELSIDVAHRVGPFVGDTGRRDDGLPSRKGRIFRSFTLPGRNRKIVTAGTGLRDPVRLPQSQPTTIFACTGDYPQLKISRNFLDDERRKLVWGRETPSSTCLENPTTTKKVVIPLSIMFGQKTWSNEA